MGKTSNLSSKEDDSGSNLRILETEYENAQERLNQQQECLKEFSKEGMQMFRLILLFVAAPIALLGALDPQTLYHVNSAIMSNDCVTPVLGPCISFRTASYVTGTFLIISAGVNLFGAGYEARGVHNLSNPKDISWVLSTDHSEKEYLQDRLETYRNRIKHNDSIIGVKEFFLAFGKFTLLLSIFGITTIAAALIIGSPIGPLQSVFVLLLFLLPMVSQLRNAPDAYMDTERYPGYSPIYEVDPESFLGNTEYQNDGENETSQEQDNVDQDSTNNK
ncbi:hypothetical protein ACFR99_12775 [Haloarchaeobius amylolyticus]|uniref:Uncharacterized protein n=1 Tax=Haloarchaeobius amylolyticus TaxID=1198296 RepID=A0ABD6BHH0_9EURY